MRSSIRGATHGAAFLLVASSKTVYNVGAACLTVDAMVMAMYCLIEYNNKQAIPSQGLKDFSISLQAIAATFSTIVVVLSRYPEIWKNLKISQLQETLDALKEELQDCGRLRKWLLVGIGVFGLLACIARGISAYLGTEVILGDRLSFEKTGVAIFAWLIAITVVISSMCFYLVSMLTAAARYLKQPAFKLSAGVVVGFIGVIFTSVAMRFFIKEFLDRRDASSAGQITGQIVFSVAELIMGLFTTTYSFKSGWKKKAKQKMRSSGLFTFFVVGDAVSTWLGYSTITLYSILIDIFLLQSSASKDSTSVCVSDSDSESLALSWTFLTVSWMVAIPATLAYFNYLIKYAKKGYDGFVEALKLPSACFKDGLFAKKEEKDPLISDSKTVSLGSIQYHRV